VISVYGFAALAVWLGLTFTNGNAPLAIGDPGEFVRWAQPIAQSTKNLAMAIAGEAGELAAEFQWLTPAESTIESLSPEKIRDIRLEMADIQIYLYRLADVLKVDISDAVWEKMEINKNRF
jgi:NTP pyrophosphatase (non-canonical NTP hydrolase)